MRRMLTTALLLIAALGWPSMSIAQQTASFSPPFTSATYSVTGGKDQEVRGGIIVDRCFLTVPTQPCTYIAQPSGDRRTTQKCEDLGTEQMETVLGRRVAQKIKCQDQKEGAAKPRYSTAWVDVATKILLQREDSWELPKGGIGRQVVTLKQVTR